MNAPVKGTTLIGNGPDVLTRVQAVGNDMCLDPGVGTCGKNGQQVPVGVGYGHFRVDHSRDEFTKGTVHINGIEGFWGLAKVRLAKFKGLPQNTFHLHLKETEWRYNHRHTDKYQTLLRYLRKNPLS